MARQPREPDAGADGALEAAAKRLERAVALLETKLDSMQSQARLNAGSLFDFDRSKLADDLDAAKARQHELVDAGQAASEALGRAIGEIRGLLQVEA